MLNLKTSIFDDIQRMILNVFSDQQKDHNLLH